jgi:hypothetical protein
VCAGRDFRGGVGGGESEACAVSGTLLNFGFLIYPDIATFDIEGCAFEVLKITFDMTFDTICQIDIDLYTFNIKCLNPEKLRY